MGSRSSGGGGLSNMDFVNPRIMIFIMPNYVSSASGEKAGKDMDSKKLSRLVRVHLFVALYAIYI